MIEKIAKETERMKFEICGNQFLKDGEPIKIISGAVHYFRNFPDTWDDIFEKAVALGCNTVETYCAWNMHEKKIGEYDFGGILNVAEFLKKAQNHGLMAIVRPGPYVCAEWEFGGLPWWLQALPNVEIRSKNRVYMKHVKRYLRRLFKEIAPLLCTNGGNVILVQVENEYGSYGDDKAYLSEIVKIYRENGIDVPLVTSDGVGADISYKGYILDGSLRGLLETMNFGSEPKKKFMAHNELFPRAPKMCMELWSGWFDSWGEERHRTRSAEDYAKTLEEMLSFGSVNMYMLIGGTNFGFMNGALRYPNYEPTTTSYDYDALLTESGDITEKYLAVRETIARCTGRALSQLPPVPKNREKAAYGKVAAAGRAELFENLSALSAGVKSETPRCMEEYGVGYGYILYRTKLHRDYENAVLSFEEVGDRAQVYVNGKFYGTVYVNDSEHAVRFSAQSGDEIFVLCENMGRVNVGWRMTDKKGIVGRCLINGNVHFGWTGYPLPMNEFKNLRFTETFGESSENCRANTSVGGKTFYKFLFNVTGTPKDTFLRTDNFKKGFAVLNGFNLGRYWEVGPQKTLYVPAGALKEGKNELILFETDGLKGAPEIEFTAAADLGQ